MQVSGALKFGSSGSARQTIGGMHDRPPHCERSAGKQEVGRLLQHRRHPSS
jgi:hypothetical protein